MNKILSIITAGSLALLALSCVKEERAVVDFSKATAPVLQSAEVGKDLVIQYTPAVFSMDFNKNMKTYHTIALVSIEGQSANVTLSAKVDGDKLTVSGKTISNLLKGRHFQIGDIVALEAVVRGSIQDPSRGITNGFVDSKERYSFNWEVPEDAQGSPYEEYTEDSPWGITGDIPGYEINWDKDLNMWSADENRHVAAHVALKAGDKFKFRKDGGWDVNMGGTMGSIGEEFAVTQGGADIEIPKDGIYDLFLDLGSGVAIVAEAFDPLADFTETSAWGVTGALPSHGINWDKDIAMITDGTNHVALSVTIGAEDKFKFRKDGGWDVNFGGVFAAIGAEFEVTQGGPDILVGADGVYDLYLNPDAATATVAEPCGLKVSSIIGGDEPEPEPEPVEVKGWNIIGLNGDWNNDVLATEKDGVWTAYITAEDKTEFKWRMDGKWEADYGMSKDEGYTYTIGTAFPAVAGGANIPIEKGFYKVVLDLSDADAPTINVISDFEIWSLIGVNGDWNTDIDMTLTDGKWVSPATKIKDEFKIRKNHAWSADYGMSKEEGYAITVGTAFPAVAGGANIKVPAEAEYIITLDLAAETILVETALPSNTWSVIGSVSGTSWNKDFYMTNDEGVWVSEELEFTETSEFKLRFNNSWADADCIGGEEDGIQLAAGVPVVPVHPGKNLKVATPGKYHVVYDTNKGIVYLQGWALIGSIAGTSWSKDFFMTVGEDGRWWSDAVKISGEFKLRNNSSWADPDTRGYGEDGFKFTPLEAFTVASPGKNINVPEEGIFVVAYDAEKEEVTIYRAEWALIGGIAGTSWSKDFNLVELEAGVYSIASIKLEGEFKIRRNASWDDADTRGYAEEGFTFTPGTKFSVTGPGKNIKTPEAGNYKVAYTPAAEEVLITAVE